MGYEMSLFDSYSVSLSKNADANMFLIKYCDDKNLKNSMTSEDWGLSVLFI